MSYLHSHHIIHRDMKPENILTDDNLHPKISDFGLSKINDFPSISMNFQSQKGLKGTMAYMAPEVLEDENYSCSSDVYAFAMVVYEILNCEEPFKNSDTSKLMKINADYRPEIKKDVPNAYRDLIERCWSQNADERPTFDQISSELTENEEFITDNVEADEFYDYVDFIDSYKTTFDATKRAICFKDFIKAKDRNKSAKPTLFNKTKVTNSMEDSNKEEKGGQTKKKPKLSKKN